MKLKDTHPLKAYFDSYGLKYKWEDMVDAKVRSDGCYFVLLFADPPGSERYVVVDIASSSPIDGFAMQNDCSDSFTMREWRALRLVPECDWFVVPGKEGYGSLS